MSRAYWRNRANVNTVRGFYDYQGRRFSVLRDGKVQFQGDPINALDPALDVVAERMIQAVTVHVNVRGRLRMPQIELTSTPGQGTTCTVILPDEEEATAE